MKKVLAIVVVGIALTACGEYKNHERVTCYLNGEKIVHDIKWIGNYKDASRISFGRDDISVYKDKGYRNLIARYSTGTQCIMDINERIKIEEE